ncbi:hypothetical protein [Flavobacterium sp.]|uniref:hypothetical protein n=1 Tax=Flavobacterium sp. TaxID=239 RepID=UPI0026157652|nr:hypothetical protein [Flavobacterium sp.]
MKRFICKLFYFTGPLFLIVVLIEFGLRYAIPNDYKYKKACLDANASRITTLILGSSHAYFGLNPEYFDSETYNAAHTSQTIYYDYAIYKKYEKQLTQLKTVIFPISSFTFYFDIKKEKQQPFLKNYSLYYDFDKTSFLRYFEITNNRSPLDLKKITALLSSTDSGTLCSTSGWGYINKWGKTPTDHLLFLKNSGKIAAKKHTRDICSKPVQELYTYNLSLLEMLITDCKRHNITILFFTPPAFQTYRDNLDKKQLQHTIKTIENLVAKHEHCRYINLLDDPRFTANDFYDTDHLNASGAKKLSTYLNKRTNNTLN